MNHDEQRLEDYKTALVGRRLTNIGFRTYRSGDQYVRLTFENEKGNEAYFEYLPHFTPSEHKMAIAEKALEKISEEVCACSLIASDALFDMERYK